MNRATKILVAGIFVNLCLGVLYSWSVFSKSLINDMGWSTADAGSPYAVAFLVFSVCVLIAGYLQDRMGPQRLVILGATLVGSGMIASSFAASSPMLLNITFGLMVGAGIGFAYACLCPAAMKWFHASKKGMVNGLIVGAFGFAPVYMAPLATWMIEAFGLSTSFLALGCGVLAIAVPLAFTIVNPPADYKAEVPAGYKGKSGAAPADMVWKEMLKTRQFYQLFVMFAFGSAAGAMIIGNFLSIISLQSSLTDMAYIISLLAVFNCAGRVGMGMLSDKIGCINTLLVAFAIQGANMFLFPSFSTEMAFVMGAAMAGVGYGALLAVFPSLCTEYYGLKNYGTNYGVLYLAWGISAFIAKNVIAYAGGLTESFPYFLGMLVVAAAIALITKPVKAAEQEAETELASA